MKIIEDEILIEELRELAKNMFGNLVKAVVDVEKRIMAVGGELHADEEALLIERGSEQRNLWGINIYPDIEGDDWIEFDSMTNLKPSQENRSRGVENFDMRKNIIKIVNNLIKK